MNSNLILRQSAILLLLGIALIILVAIVPNFDGHLAGNSFYKIAVSSSWRKPLNLPAAWCSFKLMLLCLGLFLVIESVGTALAVWKRKTAALLVYWLHLVPSLGLLIGGYFLMKALL